MYKQESDSSEQTVSETFKKSNRQFKNTKKLSEETAVCA